MLLSSVGSLVQQKTQAVCMHGPRLCCVAYTLAIHACTGLTTEHYIIAVQNDQVLYDCHHGHPVLVVPVGYFQKQKGKARSDQLMQPLHQFSCPQRIR